MFALEIDLFDYGVSGAEAIRFRSLENANGNIEGDPIFAGVLNGVAVPEPGSLALLASVASRCSAAAAKSRTPPGVPPCFGRNDFALETHAAGPPRSGRVVFNLE